MSEAGKIPKLLAAIKRGEVTDVIIHPETAAASPELLELFISAGLKVRQDRNVEKGQIIGVNAKALLPPGFSIRNTIANQLGKIAPDRLARLRKRLGGNELQRRLTDGKGDE